MVSAVSRPQESRFPSASSGPGAGMCSYVQLICALTKSTEACWVQKTEEWPWEIACPEGTVAGVPVKTHTVYVISETSPEALRPELGRVVPQNKGY